MGYTDKRRRPLARRALITFWPVWLRIRALKPEVLFCLRLVPPRVRWVMVRWVFTSGDVVAEKPQFFSLAEYRAFFDNLDHIGNIVIAVFGENLKNLIQHSFQVCHSPIDILQFI
jgi:hypothetical protein